MILNENKIINEIYSISIQNNVAVIRDKTAQLLVDMINESKAQNVLEIGTGVGYSCAIISMNCNVSITTIEKDKIRYSLAKKNLIQFHKIKLINDDCFKATVDENYDFIFIDGPKKNQIELIEKYMQKLNRNGIIFIDNIFMNKFRNLQSMTNNQRKILDSIDEMVSWIKNQTYFNYHFFNIDDGVVILYKKD